MQHRAMLRILFPLALSALAGPAAGQQGTDIFVGRLSLSGGQIVVSQLRNATNRNGYDNQPSFDPTGAFVLYTSGRPDGQTEIFRYDIAAGGSENVTNTPESEYSPTPMPGVHVHNYAPVNRSPRHPDGHPNHANRGPARASGSP